MRTSNAAKDAKDWAKLALKVRPCAHSAQGLESN